MGLTSFATESKGELSAWFTELIKCTKFQTLKAPEIVSGASRMTAIP